MSESILCAETALEKVMESGACQLYDAYLKPKLKPHIVKKYINLVSEPAKVTPHNS